MAVQGALITPTVVTTWMQPTLDGKQLKYGIFYSVLAATGTYATGGGDYVDFSKWFNIILWADAQVVQVATPVANYAAATSATLNAAAAAKAGSVTLGLAYGQDITPANLPGFYTNVAGVNKAVVYINAMVHSHGNGNTYATATYTQGEVGGSNELAALDLSATYGRWLVYGL